MHHAKLVTVYTEAALESELIREMEKLHVSGYTISNARGKGARGARTGAWEASSNIRVEIICDDALAKTLIDTFTKKYYDHYAMVAFISDIEVIRQHKFQAD